MDDDLVTRIYVSYHPVDDALWSKLEAQLAIQEEDLAWVTICTSDRVAQPGGEVEISRRTYLDRADVVLLLISADSLKGPRALSERRLALQRAKEEASSVHVIPVLLRAISRRPADLDHLQWLPRSGNPIADAGSLDKELADVGNELWRMIEPHLKKKKALAQERAVAKARAEAQARAEAEARAAAETRARAEADATAAAVAKARAEADATANAEARVRVETEAKGAAEARARAEAAAGAAANASARAEVDARANAEARWRIDADAKAAAEASVRAEAAANAAREATARIEAELRGAVSKLLSERESLGPAMLAARPSSPVLEDATRRDSEPRPETEFGPTAEERSLRGSAEPGTLHSSPTPPPVQVGPSNQTRPADPKRRSRMWVVALAGTTACGAIIGLVFGSEWRRDAGAASSATPPVLTRTTVASAGTASRSQTATFATSRETRSDTVSPRCPVDMVRIEGRTDFACIGETEVTVRDFLECEGERGCSKAEDEYSRKNASCNRQYLSAPDDRSQHPMNCVNQDDASAYCKWRYRDFGGALPNAAQWQAAVDGAVASGRPFRPDPKTICWDQGVTCPVTQHPQGRTKTGLLGTVGNVAEWTTDTYKNDRSEILGRTCGRGFDEPRLEVLVGTCEGAYLRGGRPAALGFRCVAQLGAVSAR